jgi:SNF2 family DNA or RNA helicase
MDRGSNSDSEEAEASPRKNKQTSRRRPAEVKEKRVLTEEEVATLRAERLQLLVKHTQDITQQLASRIRALHPDAIAGAPTSGGSHAASSDTDISDSTSIVSSATDALSLAHAASAATALPRTVALPGPVSGSLLSITPSASPSRLKHQSAPGSHERQSMSQVRQPDLITGTRLHGYQLTGVAWLASLHAAGLSGILADEMGLGE